MLTAFEGHRPIAAGEVADVALAVKARADLASKDPLLIFDDQTGHQVELDFRGSAEDVLARVAPAAPGPGRPRLGVVGREVTLLPRHWEWLGKQAGGASVALRKLVEAARRAGDEADRVRLSNEAAYRFLSAIAGNLPGFEEAVRALFAGKRKKFKREMAGWPADIRDHALRVSARSFEKSE